MITKKNCWELVILGNLGHGIQTLWSEVLQVPFAKAKQYLLQVVEEVKEETFFLDPGEKRVTEVLLLPMALKNGDVVEAFDRFGYRYTAGKLAPFSVKEAK